MGESCHMPSTIPMPMGVGICPRKTLPGMICSIIWPMIPNGLAICTCQEPISVCARPGGCCCHGESLSCRIPASAVASSCGRGGHRRWSESPCWPVIPHTSHVHGVGIGLAEVDPRHALQEERQVRLVRRVGQKHRDHRRPLLDKLAQKRGQLLVLPGTDAFASDKHCGRLDAADLLLQRVLPRQAGTKLPLIQPGQDSQLFQVAADLLDLRLVAVVVTKEYIKGPGRPLAN